MLHPTKIGAAAAFASWLTAATCATPRPIARPVVAENLISSSQLPPVPPATPIAKPGRADVDEYDVPTARYVTRLVRRDSLSPGERARINDPSNDIHNGSFPPPESFVFTELVLIFGETGADECRRYPPNPPSISFNLKPGTKVANLVAWIALVTCRQFMLPVALSSMKLTVAAPRLMTPDQAYNLFLRALDSVGLTVDESGAPFILVR
jgi:hypothetical protein